MSIITLNEAKQQCRIDHDYDDAYLQALIDAAESFTSEFRGTPISSTTKTQYFETWDDEYLQLQYTPVTAITSITYTDTDGTTDTWSSSDYLFTSTGRITPAYDEEWPDIQERLNSITVTYIAGYTTTTIPKHVKQAVLFLVGHFYEHRMAVSEGYQLKEVPMAFSALALIDGTAVIQ